MTPVDAGPAEAPLVPIPLRLPAAERAKRRPGARVEPRRHRDGHLDLAAMERTIPRGRDAEDGDPTPAVDPSVWFLHVRFHRTQDPALLDGLVQEYERYALSIARRFHREREPREDLDQVAREALIGALHRFDPERGLPFPSFATPTIVGALRRHFRDRGWAVRVPRQVHELTVAARTTTERLTPVLGRPPTIAEVAHELGVDLDDLLHAEEAVHARETASLDATPDEGSGSLLDQIGSEDGSIDLAENLLDLRRAMAEIAPDDRALLQLYYFENCSQVEIAQRLGVSQMQVSRLLTSTLRRLRRRMGPR